MATTEKKDKENYFKELSELKPRIEQKNGLTYVTWADAWAEIKKVYPDANYKIWSNPQNGMPYFLDDSGGFVHVSVIVNKIEHEVYLPIMNYSNKSIKKAEITTFDTNKSIQRALAKGIAMHGLGLFAYKGEDLPEEPKPVKQGQSQDQPHKEFPSAKEVAQKKEYTGPICANPNCKKPISDGIAKFSTDKYGVSFCIDCQKGVDKKQSEKKPQDNHVSSPK